MTSLNNDGSKIQQSDSVVRHTGNCIEVSNIIKDVKLMCHPLIAATPAPAPEEVPEETLPTLAPSLLAELVFQLDSMDEDSISLTGSDVNSWTDSIGSKVYSSQGTKAVLVSDEYTKDSNARNVIRFLNGKYSVFQSMFQEEFYTLYALVGKELPSANPHYILSNGFSPNNAALTSPTNGAPSWQQRDSSTIATSLLPNSTATNSAGELSLLSVTMLANRTMLIRYNQVEGATSDAAPETTFSGQSYIGGTAFVNSLEAFDVAELLIFSKTHSDAERGLVEDYLMAKWPTRLA